MFIIISLQINPILICQKMTFVSLGRIFILKTLACSKRVYKPNLFDYEGFSNA